MPLINFGAFLIFLVNSILVPLIFAIAFIVFLWGVYTYFILGAGNDEKRKEGRSFIVYALIGFFIMISVWGLVNILVNSFGFNAQKGPAYLPRSGGGTGSGAYDGGAKPSIFSNDDGTGLFDLLGSLF